MHPPAAGYDRRTAVVAARCNPVGPIGARSVQAACYAAVSRTPLVLFVNVSEHRESGRNWIRRRLRRWLIRRATGIAVNGISGVRI